MKLGLVSICRIHLLYCHCNVRTYAVTMSEFSFSLLVDDLMDLPDFDFDLGISDSQIPSATQLLDLTMPVNNLISGQLNVINEPGIF